MKRWIWGLLALSAFGLALVFALFYPGGSETPKSSAEFTGQVALDLDGSDGWCTDIDNTADATTGSTHQAAICLLGGNAHLQTFNIVVNYDSTKNSCVSKGQTGTGLDANPDFLSTVGTGWDCSGGGVNYPKCGETAGEAYISCGTTTEPPTTDTNWAIAVIEWTADTAGADALTFGTAAFYDWDGENVLRCPGVDCLGATVTKLGPATPTFTPLPPTPTPTITPTPEFTPTPLPPNADMGVTLTDDPDPVVVGEEVTYTATVTNNGGPNDALGVELVFTLPAEKLYVTDSADCDDDSICTYDAGPPETITCALGDINDDAPPVVCNITATALTEGTHETTASVSATLGPVDLNPTNNEDSEETTEVLPHAYIDKVDNGDGWCDIIDDETTEIVGDTHQLAVCVKYLPEAVGGFDLDISYDDVLDSCTEVPCTDGLCLNDNPDASSGLGAQWDCDIDDDQPVCHQQLPSAVQAGAGDGLATIHCTGDGNITEGPLAVLELGVEAPGTDNVDIDWLVVYNVAGAPIAHCVGQDSGGLEMTCQGARDNKVEPTATPTATNTPTITPTPPPETHKRPTRTPTPAPPTATPVPPTVPPPPPPPPPPTATPLGGVGPEIIAPATGSGSPVGGFTWAIWLAAGIAGVAAAAGFYFRYSKKAR